MSIIPPGKHWSEVRSVRDLVHQLRRERKAALRECGHLGEKLHTARLEAIVLRQQIKATRDALKEVLLTSRAQETANDSLRAHVQELEQKLLAAGRSGP